MRRFDGATFGAGVKIADLADDAQAHLAQDPAGRLHAVFAHNTVAGLELDYATSDNGVSWQSGPLLTQTTACRASASCARRPRPTTSGSRRGRRLGRGSRSASSASARRGRPRRRCRASRSWSASVSGQVFVTSRGRQAHAADRRGEHPRRRQVDTRKGRVRLTSAATGAGTTTQTAEFYQGAFKVRQSVPKGNRTAALTTDITLAARRRGRSARRRGAQARRR